MARRRLTPDQRAAIARRYDEDRRISALALAREHGVSDGTVRAILKEFEIPIRSHSETAVNRRGITDPTLIRRILRLHKDGLNLLSIARQVGWSYTGVRSCLLREGVDLGPAANERKYPLNDHAFDEVTPESAYWLGFLMADGHVCRKRRYFDNERAKYRLKHHIISIGLKAADVAHVIAFSEYIGTSPDRVHEYANDGSGTAQFSFTSEPMFRALAKHGVKEDKTANGRVPAHLRTDRHYWRGFVDGDGCFDVNGRFAVESGAQHVVESLAQSARTITGSKASVRRERRSASWSFHLSRGPAAQWAHHLYRNGEIHLPHRFAQAEPLVVGFASGEIVPFRGRVTADERKSMVTAYARDRRMKNLEARFGRSRATIRRVLRREGVYQSPRKTPQRAR